MPDRELAELLPTPRPEARQIGVNRVVWGYRFAPVRPGSAGRRAAKSGVQAASGQLMRILCRARTREFRRFRFDWIRGAYLMETACMNARQAQGPGGMGSWCPESEIRCAPRAAMRPDGKARRVRISGVFER